MKKSISLIFALLICSNVYAADSKISALTEDTSPSTDSLLYCVDDPGGTPASRKCTIANTLIDANIPDTITIPKLRVTQGGPDLLTIENTGITAVGSLICAGCVGASDMNSEDHGDFTYSGGSATLDSGVVDSAEIATDAVQVTELDDGSDTASNDDVVMIDNADNTQFAYIDVPDCDDSGGNHINYDTATQSFSCGSSGDGVGGGGTGAEWTDNGSTLSLPATETTDNVLIGTTIDLGKLAVFGDNVSEITLVVREMTAQTASIAVFEDSGGVDRVTIEDTGLTSMVDISCDNCIETADIAADSVGESELIETMNFTTTGTWIFTDTGTGAFDSYDAQFGDVTTPDYGGIRIGASGLYRTSNAPGAMDFGGAIILRNEANLDAGNDPGIEFAIMEGGNTVRLAIPESGAGNASAFFRSLTLGGAYNQANGNAQMTCAHWSAYDSNIDCDSDLTGPDLFVKDDIELEGTLFVSGGNIKLDSDDANSLTISATSQTAAHTFDFPDDEIADLDLIIGDGAGSFGYTAMSGDATLANNGALTIALNSVALADDTTGNYVATIADAGSGEVTVTGSGSENASVTLDLPNYSTTKSKSVTIINPQYGDSIPFWQVPYNITIVDVDAIMTGITGFSGALKECNSSAQSCILVHNNITLTSTFTNGNASPLDNASIDANDYLMVDINGVTGATGLVTVSFDYTIN